MSFNFFKRPQKLDNKKEAPVPALAAEERELPEQSLEADGTSALDFKAVLSRLQELIVAKEGLGQVTPAELESAAKMKISELMNFLNGENLEIDATGEQLFRVVKESLGALDQPATQNSFQKFANDPMTRAAFVALMISLKLAPDVQAAEAQFMDNDKVGGQTEIKATVGKEIEPDKIYQAGAEDFKKKTDKKENDARPLEGGLQENNKFTKLDFTAYFETDSDGMLTGAEIKIADDFEKFLSKITPENAKDLIAADFKIYGSSDERPTSRPGGNEKLTNDRLQRINKILTEVLAGYDFKNLSKDLADQIKAKGFILDSPQDGAEKGVAYIADLIDPATGVKFTAERIEEIKKDPHLYQEYLSKCRQVNFEVEINHQLPFLAGYDKVAMIFDNTGSVSEGDRLPTNKYMANIFKQAPSTQKQKLYFGTFDSNGPEGITAVPDLSALSTNLDKMVCDGDGREEAAQRTARETLRTINFNSNEKNAVVIFTDEPLQDFTLNSYAQLVSLAQNKGADVTFCYADDQKEKLFFLNLKDVGKALQEQRHEIILEKMALPNTLNVFLGQQEQTIKGIEREQGFFKARYELFKKSLSQKENQLKTWQQKVDSKTVDSTNYQYQKALESVSNVNANMIYFEAQVQELQAKIDQCRQEALELPILVKSYLDSQDESMLDNPNLKEYYKRVQEYNLIDKDYVFKIAKDKFQQEFDLSKL